MMNLIKRVVICFAMAVTFGAALNNSAFSAEGDLSGSNYETYEARRVQRVTLGIVMAVRQVESVKTSSRPGNLLGTASAIAGGLVAASTGNRNNGMAVLGSAALAGFAGKMIGDATMGEERKQMMEVVVGLSNRNIISVVQEMDADVASLKKGDIVRLMDSSVTGNVRVARFD